MGGIFGRRKTNQFDPNFPPYNDPYYPGMSRGGFGGPPLGGFGGPPTGRFGMPPSYPYGAGYDPSGGLGSYDPYEAYGYGYEPTEPFETYYGGGPMRGGPYGGRYGRGFNQMSRTSPWNYGNFYMGNTTMQMIPYMKRKIAKFEQRQGMGSMGGGFGGGMPAMPMMPMMPCLPASFSMPMASPMIAAATPLPIAFNPLVQGMYPMASMNASSWMTPSSFMSALSSGPMGYRPPPSIEFPNNIGMVMPFPYGTPNPLLTPSSFGGFSPQYNFGSGLSCCCCFCSPPVAPPPPICYYPRPVNVPQPVPVPYPTPVPIPNIQQVPVPRHVSVVAPPIIAGGNQPFSIPAGAPLVSSQGGLIQGGLGQSLVMGSNQNSTTQTLLKDETSPKPKRRTTIHQPIDHSRRAKAQKLAASLSNLGLTNTFPADISSIKNKNRLSYPNFSPSDTIPSRKRHRKSTHHHHHRNSNHDYVISTAKQLKKRS